MDKYSTHKALSIEALKQYDIDYKNIEFLIEETNIFFLIKTDQEKYVLKIFQEESSKLEDNLIEAALLKSVSEKSDIIVPSIVSSKTGEDIIFIESKDFETRKRVAVYRFVEGEHFDKIETDELFVKVGRTMASLHQATKEIVLPNVLKPKRWDKVFYYRDEEVLFK